MDRLERYFRDPLLSLGVLALGVGFLAIGLGWLGSARRACVDCQIPYLISGGAAGLALVVSGSALLVVRAMRAQQRDLQESLRGLREDLTAAGAASYGEGNGHKEAEVVTVGASSYHRADCHLVQGRGDAEEVPLETAQVRDLSPCRICEPPV